MEKEGIYIYCVAYTTNSKSFGHIGIGERGDEVHAICFNDVAAVVSNSPQKEYKALRDNMIAHEKAIEEVMKEHTVLPVRFSTVAESEEKIKKILEKEYGRFKDLLNKFKDKKELGLKAMFKEEAIYKYILEKYEQIKRLKDKIAQSPPEKTYPQRMEIGRMVEQALEKEKEKCKEEILNTLEPLSEDVKLNNTYGERMIINSAFLINKDKEAEFDEKVNEFDAKYGDKIKFMYVGTLPPFNFVNLVIKTEEY